MPDRHDIVLSYGYGHVRIMLARYHAWTPLYQATAYAHIYRGSQQDDNKPGHEHDVALLTELLPSSFDCKANISLCIDIKNAVYPIHMLMAVALYKNFENTQRTSLF